MKASYDRRNSDIYLSISVNKSYKDSYKSHMLNENNMSGIIPYIVENTKEGCEYNYKVSGMISMKNKFLGKSICRQDMISFIKDLHEASIEAKKYMLNTDELLMYPELIFYDKGKWRFCYFPYRGKKFEDSFLRIKDFFVKRIDNNDLDAIVFAHKLNKTTLSYPYSPESILMIANDDSNENEESDKPLPYENTLEVIHDKVSYIDEDSSIKMVCEEAEDKSLLGYYRRRKERKENRGKKADEENKTNNIVDIDEKKSQETKEKKRHWGSW